MRIDTNRISIRNHGQVQIEIAAYRMQTETEHMHKEIDLSNN